jgi:hypothetical protein
MSVGLLLPDVAALRAPFLAVISGDLFMDLFAAGELSVALQAAKIPSDPKYGAIIDEWLKSEGVNPNAPITVPDYHLTAYPPVHVRLDADYGLELAPTGIGSYRIY